eukprot:TRINITY_DN5421_c0_g1_i4.p1 TRINITY_DN5421_c0_g1~~TRINITY_DN5421_c0_g1_i4.p1  ORF type:complete len:508 (+),score=174.40 TRINITY_DN5421_c0_g1_i4:122-1645(+)
MGEEMGEEGWLDAGAPAPKDASMLMHRGYRTRHGVEVRVGDDVMAWRRAADADDGGASAAVTAEDVERSEVYRVWYMYEDAEGRKWAKGWRWLRVGDAAPAAHFAADRGDFIHRKELFPCLPDEGEYETVALGLVHQKLTIRAASGDRLDIDDDEYGDYYCAPHPKQSVINATLALNGARPGDPAEGYICCWHEFLRSSHHFVCFRAWDPDEARPGGFLSEADAAADACRRLAAKQCQQCLLRERNNFSSITQVEGAGATKQFSEDGVSETAPGEQTEHDFGPSTLTPEDATRDNVSLVLKALDDGAETTAHGEGDTQMEGPADDGEAEEDTPAAAPGLPAVQRAYDDGELEDLLAEYAAGGSAGAADLAVVRRIVAEHRLLALALPHAVLNPPTPQPPADAGGCGRKSVSSAPPPLPLPARGKLGTHIPPPQEPVDDGGVKAVDLASVDFSYPRRAPWCHGPAVPDEYHRLQEELAMEVTRGTAALARVDGGGGRSGTPPPKRRKR